MRSSKLVAIAGLAVTLIALSGLSMAQQNTYVYVSFLSGLNTGGTNVYQITSSGAQLLGTTAQGGGGPVAVDSQQNMYTVQADYDDSLYQIDSPIYVSPPGSTQSTHLFTAPGLGAETMTVDSAGTVYIAGMNYPNVNTFSVWKFSPPDYVGEQLPADSQAPSYAVGITLDNSGNLYVGYTISNVDYPFGVCASGCIEELPAGTHVWQTRIPDLAANSMAAGPFSLDNLDLVFWTGQSGRFNYFETVPFDHTYPSRVIQQSPNLVLNGGNPALAMQADQREMWATGTGFGGPLGTNVTGIAYPGGNILTQFSVDAPADLIFITGIGVSPSSH